MRLYTCYLYCHLPYEKTLVIGADTPPLFPSLSINALIAFTLYYVCFTQTSHCCDVKSNHCYIRDITPKRGTSPGFISAAKRRGDIFLKRNIATVASSVVKKNVYSALCFHLMFFLFFW